MNLGIRAKLIIIMLAANCLVAAAMVWLSNRQFDQGFSEYINQLEIQKLKPFTEELALNYAQHNGWGWVRNQPGLWQQIVAYHLKGRLHPDGRPRSSRTSKFSQFNQAEHTRGRPRQPSRFQGDQRAEPYQPQVQRISGVEIQIRPRMQLRDTKQNLIIGAPQNKELHWLSIELDGKVIGDLGVVLLKQSTSEIEGFFIAKQKKVLLMVVVVMLLVAVILAFWLFTLLMRHINLYKQGLSSLVAGDYDLNLPSNSEDELAQLATDLNLLSRTLNENRTSRQQWIADISHELRTPVAILKGEIEALIEGVREVNASALQSLHQETERLTLLINDLHELSLSDLGALSYNKEEIDFAELVSDFVEEHSGFCSQQSLAIVLNLNLNNALILADSSRLEQCLTNCLQNTLRYTDLPGELNISLTELKGQYVLLWQDTAPGVSNDDLEHLFERLYRVDKSRNRAQGGSGLGLSICENIIAAHDAEISVFQSELGGLGLRFVFPKSVGYE